MMTGGGARRVDLSESLFSADEEDDPKPGPSPQLAAMMGEVERRRERRKSKKTIAASQFGRARVEVEAMIESGKWTGVSARHLVALYDLMHERVYGVACAELGPEARYNATMMAASLTKREFGGDYEKTLEFMRWAWTRESRTEKWRRENGRHEARRIGARLMFSGSLVTDYRVFLARTGKKL